MEIIKLEFRPSDILTWLNGKSDDEVVHKVEDVCHECLFANYLQERFDDPEMELGAVYAYSSESYSSEGDATQYKLPKWAAMLVPIVDMQAHFKYEQCLTVGEVRELVETCV